MTTSKKTTRQTKRRESREAAKAPTVTVEQLEANCWRLAKTREQITNEANAQIQRINQAIANSEKQIETLKAQEKVTKEEG